jgi:hypothetical protein
VEWRREERKRVIAFEFHQDTKIKLIPFFFPVEIISLNLISKRDPFPFSHFLKSIQGDSTAYKSHGELKRKRMRE